MEQSSVGRQATMRWFILQCEEERRSKLFRPPSWRLAGALMGTRVGRAHRWSTPINKMSIEAAAELGRPPLSIHPVRRCHSTPSTQRSMNSSGHNLLAGRKLTNHASGSSVPDRSKDGPKENRRTPIRYGPTTSPALLQSAGPNDHQERPPRG
jgi:hypothetical protein